MCAASRWLSLAWVWGEFACGGCGTYHAYPGERRPADQVALVYFGDVAARPTKVDGNPVRPGLDCGKIALLPGQRVLTVETKWSNRMKQAADLSWTAVAGRRYFIRVQEFEPARKDTFWDGLGRSALQGAAQGAAPVVATVGVALLLLPPPTEPPPNHVLGVWLADEENVEPPVAPWAYPPGLVIEQMTFRRVEGTLIRYVGVRPAEGKSWQQVRP